jgi:hypothetical protein
MRQRFKRHNSGARLPLIAEDFLIARQTPGPPVGGVWQHVRRRVACDGYAELSIHEYGRDPASFRHAFVIVTPAQLDRLREALSEGLEAMAGIPVSKDPSGTFRRIEFWKDGEPAMICMEDLGGTPRYSIPAFERAWGSVVGLFSDPAASEDV